MSPNSKTWRLRDLYGSRLSGSRGSLGEPRRPGVPNPAGADDPDGQPDEPDPASEAPCGERLGGAATVDAAAEHLLAGCMRLAVFGQPGAGKTWLLRALRSRLHSTFACVYLPVPDLPPDEIRAWIAGCDGPLPAHPGTSLEDLAAAHARHSAGLVLLVDDANAMPPEVADALDATLARTGGALRVVLAGLDEDPRFNEVLGRFSEPFERIAMVRTRPADDRFESSAPEPPAAPEPAPPTEPDDEGALPYPSPPVAVSDAQPDAQPVEQPSGTGTPAGADAVAVSSSRTADPLGRAHDRARLSRLRKRGSLLSAALVAVPLAVAIGHWSATSRRATPDRVVPESTLARVPSGPGVAPASDAAVPPGLPHAGEADRSPTARSGASEAPSEASGSPPAGSGGSLRSVPRSPVQPVPAPEAVEIAAPQADERFESSAPEPSASPDSAPPTEPSSPVESSLAAVASAPSAASAVPAEPATPLLAVHVNARPWARITVNGRELGLTPLGNVPLAEGTHHFRAELPDGLVIERDVHVDADNRQVTFP